MVSMSSPGRQKLSATSLCRSTVPMNSWNGGAWRMILPAALATMLAQNDWPPLGRNEQTQEFQSQQWLIVTDVQTAPDPDLRKIEMSVGLVREGEREPTPLLRLTTYRGEY